MVMVDAPETTQGRRQRILIVDDAAVVRRALRRLLERESDCEIVDAVADGRQAIRAAAQAALAGRPVGLVLLDIEMPVLDGLAALPELLRIEPRPRIVMTSVLTRHGAIASLKALAAGASDYICKPRAADALASDEFRRELLGKIRSWAAVDGFGGPTGRGPGVEPSQRRLGGETGQGRAPAHGSDDGAKSRHAPRQEPFLLPQRDGAQERATGGAAPARQGAQPWRRTAGRIDAIAIGSSTGGPQALLKLLAGLRGMAPRPIFVTQHMPPTFTTILAEQLGRAIGRACVEAPAGELVRADGVYLAPGDFHLLIEAAAQGLRLQLTQDAPENFCRPAVDPMFRSLAQAYGSRTVAVVLTGMGRDGCKGCAAIRAAGGMVVAQDEATSVVWGMPGAVATGGLADAVLPLEEIAPFLRALVEGR
jgi:two-component system chemotaxis response regulator CheB